MYKIIVFKGNEYKLSHSKYLNFIAYSKALSSTSWNDDEKKVAIERYLNTLIN